MIAVTSTQMCSVQARPAKLFSRGKVNAHTSRTAVRVMAASKDASQTTPQRVMALLAAAQLVAMPLAGSALAADTVRVAELSDAAESVKAKLPELPNPFFGRSEKENKGPQDASSGIQESIKKSQGGKTSEADSLADKLNKGAPASGAPSTAGVGKSLGTTDGGL